MRIPYLLIAAFVFTITSGTANAAVIFADDFDTENGGVAQLNFEAFDNFTVSDGSVDLIGNGSNDLLPGNGLYVDLDGSTSNAGVLSLTDSISLATDVTYTFSYDLAGSQRGSTEFVDVTLFGDGLAFPILHDRDSSEGFVTESITFTPLSTEFGPTVDFSFSFANRGGDNVGALLDNVRLTSEADAVPEPTALFLLGTAAAGSVLNRRRRNRASSSR